RFPWSGSRLRAREWSRLVQPLVKLQAKEQREFSSWVSPVCPVLPGSDASKERAIPRPAAFGSSARLAGGESPPGAEEAMPAFLLPVAKWRKTRHFRPETGSGTQWAFKTTS